MSNQEDLPYWRQGRLAPEEEQVIDDQYRAFTETREVARTTVPSATAQNAPAASGPSASQEPPRERSRWPRRIGFAVLGLLGVAALIGVGYWFAQSEMDGIVDTALDDEPSSPQLLAESVDEDTAKELTIGPIDGEEDQTGTASPDDGDEATDGDADADADADATTASDGDADEDVSDPELERFAVLKGGKVYLRGKIPSQDLSDQVAAKAMAVVGPENVVVEYEIDETSVIRPGDSAPLYVEDVVLFEFNSTAVAKDFLPLLDLGVILLRQNPQASVTVVTHTDSVGSEEVNLDVANKRANAVANYWLGKGVAESQIKTDPRGESEAAGESDEATAQLQRRAEFIITGLLD